MKRNKIALALGLTATLGLFGCNDNDSTSTQTEGTSVGGNGTAGQTQPVNYSVTAIDGYLQNARVWLDLNGNFELDEANEEPFATSGEGGVANLDVSSVDDPSKYSVVVQAIPGETIDEDNPDTPIETAYVMSAPAGETDVTPLSTMVNIYLTESTDGTETAEELEQKKAQAVSDVANELGLPQDDILGDFIEAGASEALFAAQAIVDAGILPEDPQAMVEVIEVIEDTPDDSVFLKVASAVNEKIKEVVENTSNIEEEVPVFEAPIGVTDSDGDGVPDAIDFAPEDENDYLDSDRDGTGNFYDLDDDNDTVSDVDELANGTNPLNPDTDGDGVDDSADAFPLLSTEQKDNDLDGIGDNADADDDNDELTDEQEKALGTNPLSADTDEDGVSDKLDAFPLDETEQSDFDSDGVGDVADLDDDNDGVDDLEELQQGTDPLNSDSDFDGVEDGTDKFPTNSSEWSDDDDDGLGDQGEDPNPNDTDNDGYTNDIDFYPTDPSKWDQTVEDFLAANQNLYRIYVSDLYGENIWDAMYSSTFSYESDVISMDENYIYSSSMAQFTHDLSSVNELVLTDDGWLKLGKYSFDLSNEQYVAVPENGSGKYSDVSISVVDLEGANQWFLGLWAGVADDTFAFSRGSRALEVSYSSDVTQYFIYEGFQPWVWFSDDSGIADTHEVNDFSSIISTEAAGEANIYDITAVNINSSIGVEFVTGGTANYYEFHWLPFGIDESDPSYATLIASVPSGYQEITSGGESFISFTVPDAVVDLDPSSWEFEATQKVLAMYNGYLTMGDFLNPGDEMTEFTYLLNQQAANEVNAAITLPDAVALCSGGDSSDPDQLLDNLTSVISIECSGGVVLDGGFVEGNSFYRQEPDGRVYFYEFEPNGDVVIVDPEGREEIGIWDIEGGYVRIDLPLPDTALEDDYHTWYWGLVDGSNLTYSFKFFETQKLDDVESTSIWSDIVYKNESLEACYEGDSESSDPNLTLDGDFANAINTCGGYTPLTHDAVVGLTLVRDRSDGNTRSFTFNDDNTVNVVKSEGGEYSDYWSIDSDGYILISYVEGEKGADDYYSEETYWAVLGQSRSTWSIKYFEIESSGAEPQVDHASIWADLVNVSYTSSEGGSINDYDTIAALYTDELTSFGDGWDDEAELPTSVTDSSGYDALVSRLLDEVYTASGSGIYNNFHYTTGEDGIERIIFAFNDERLTFTRDQDGIQSGDLTVVDGDENPIETQTFTWAFEGDGVGISYDSGRYEYITMLYLGIGPDNSGEGDKTGGELRFIFSVTGSGYYLDGGEQVMIPDGAGEVWQDTWVKL